MKKYTIALLMLLASLCSTAQVTNNALSLERNGRVSLGVLPSDIADSGTTLQLWMNPQHWIPGANIVTWGESLNLQLGKPGELVVKSCDDTLSFTSSNLATGNWSHITLLFEGNGVGLLVNNANQQNGTLSQPFAIPAEAPLLLGGGFLGRIDEVRVWDFILPAD